MRASCLLMSAVFFAQGAACANPHCPPGERKIGDRCFLVRLPDAGDAGEDDERDDDDATSSSDAGSAPSLPRVPIVSTMDAATSDAGPSRQCYADRDGDGVGSGPAVECVTALMGQGDAGRALLVTRGDDCDDNDPKRSPALSDVCGDNLDNDCDGKPDDESNNACGGPCSTPLAHKPGEACTAGEGVCKTSGMYECAGQTTRCNAPVVMGSAELCDGMDNDCDGTVDENVTNACGGPCSVKLPDKLGAPCTNGQLGACARTAVFVCDPGGTTVCAAPRMNPGMDCMGTNPDKIDNDCDGQVDEGFATPILNQLCVEFPPTLGS